MMKKETFSLREFAKDYFFYRMDEIYPPTWYENKRCISKKASFR